MENKEKVYTERVEPLLRAAYDIAVAHGMSLVWTTCTGDDGKDFLLNTSTSVTGIVGKDVPPCYFYACKILGIDIAVEQPK